ncbi:hypothetical protein QQS21_005864 [Conoideocrella luteorostrata]|uniref:Uncharacterized protein n=1 Tax=Conoideocrella luteorostrata TaxID=1105319 RepID=A0AAJ0FYS5_9HYPO|nr:hypothetical protein QQS21_005864 [Conoideocrella luteorostrata]
MAGENNFTQLQFGVELEMVLRPRANCVTRLVEEHEFDNSPGAHLPIMQGGNRDDNRKAICEYLERLLILNSLPARLFNEDQSDYTKWTIDEDPSIRE